MATGRETSAAVGIDLGTTNSVIAVYEDGEVHVLVDEEGHNITPSVVAFTDLSQLVGWEALKQYADNPNNTVSGKSTTLLNMC